MAGSSGIVPVRYPASDVEIIELAMAIMGSRSISAFTREASVKLAKAIVDADIRAGEGNWDSCRVEGALERKP